MSGTSANPPCHQWPCGSSEISDIHFVLPFRMDGFKYMIHLNTHTQTHIHAVNLRKEKTGKDKIKEMKMSRWRVHCET